MHKSSWVPVVSVMGSLVGCGDVPLSDAETLDSSRQGLLPIVTCPVGAVVVTFEPPLRAFPQDVLTTTSQSYSNCTTLLGDPVTSASTSRQTLQRGLTCDSLLGILSTRSALTWNTGETSNFVNTQIRLATEPPTSVAVEVGTVSSGKFEGSTAVRTATYLSADIAQCQSEAGVARLEGL
ncbi:hypothetical protein [Myxococcus faecalis]|uniref:hypothetical protein n=1 Tax=Myxococcus faecalis TaxID=3115646 RepID=UPI003CF5568C